LNEVLEGRWSFRVLSHHIDPDEVYVHCEMQVDDTVRQQFGSSSITRKQGTGETISIADDLKSATSDALKKIASSFGVGLSLYGGSTQSKPQRQGNGNGRVTNDTIAKIFSTSKQAGVPQSQVIKTAMETYGKPISQLSMQQAEELIDQFAVKTEGG